MRLTPKTVAALKTFVEATKDRSNRYFDFSHYMRKMDLLYLREQDAMNLADGRAGRLEAAQVNNEFVAPVVYPMVDSARAYFANMFLAQDPIFQAAGSKRGIDAATQFNAILKRDGDREGWRSALSLSILNGLKYNLTAVEVNWQTRTRKAIDPKDGAVKDTASAGNSLKAVDLYNAWWDQAVPVQKIHTEGLYVGYSEPISAVGITQLYNDLPAEGRQCTVDAAKLSVFWNKFGVVTPFLKGVALSATHIQDLGANVGGVSAVTTDFSQFFESTPVEAKGIAGRGLFSQIENLTLKCYTKTTFYARIIPEVFGISMPGGDTPMVWKFIYINSALFWAGPEKAIHDYLPVIFCQPLNDGFQYQGISYAENLGDIQILASKLWTAELKSTDRIVGDRAIYNPRYIDAAHMRSKSPAAKIPLRAPANNQDFTMAKAYYQIPYQDSALGLRMGQSSQLFNLGNQLAGQNPTFQGSFVKGNKTDGQFAETIQGTESRMLLMALNWETDMFSPMKSIIKTNVLQFDVNSVLIDKETGAPINIDIQQLRAGNIEFELGDGLAASAAKSMLPVMEKGFAFLQTNPIMAQDYDVVGMFSYLMKLSGFRRIEDFRYTEEQKAQNAALLAARTAGTGQGQTSPVPATQSNSQ